MPRPPKILDTEWEPVIRRLIADGWSPGSISRYMQLRYGQKIGVTTIRYYKQNELKSIEEEYGAALRARHLSSFIDEKRKLDDMVDVIGVIQDLMELQAERITIDVQLERSFSKLMPSTRQELELMADLVGQLHEVYQDYGIAPKAGEQLSISLNTEPQPAKQAEALPNLWDAATDADREALIRMSRLALEDGDIEDAVIVEDEDE